jgi:hypothetical protein
MTPTDAETTFDASRATHGAATDAETTFDAYSCPYDGAACLLLGPLAAPIAQRVGRDYPAVVETAARVVPCRDCPRYSRVVVDGLAGVRLGKHERRVLLKAAECSKGAVVVPLGEGRSGEEAHRRALRRLQQVRLIRRGQDWHVWLTPQGSTVVAQIGAALRRGQPVR